MPYGLDFIFIVFLHASLLYLKVYMTETTNEIIMFDKIGQRLLPGSIIVYGHLLSRSAGLRLGKVIKLERKDTMSGYGPYDRITIQGLDCNWYPSHGIHPALLSRRSTLLFPNRTVIINEEQLPENIKELFDTVVV